MEGLEPTNTDTPRNDKAQEQNQFSFFFSGFLCKVFLFAVLIYVVPLFPSKAPEFINQTFLTRGWELIHLILVGIAVSYGLFSEINAEKEVLQVKVDDPSELFMSQVLQGESVLEDDEGETMVIDGNKTHMWNSRHYQGKPTVVVTPRNYDERDELRKPLFLPAKSLKSSISDSNDLSGGIPSESLGGELSERELMGGEEKGVILPSPIPWRLRSERMELNGESSVVKKSPPSSSSSPASPAAVVKMQTFQSRRTRRASLLPIGDPIKERSLHNSPPPPPSPPQHFFIHGSKSDLDNNNGRRSFEQKMNHTLEVVAREATRPTNKERTHDRSPPLPSAPPGPKNQHEKASGFYRKFIIDTTTSDEDSDSDRASIKREGGEEEAASNSTMEEKEEEDVNVDQMADEFIAKFREQIRLQRMESIKKSTVPNR